MITEAQKQPYHSENALFFPLGYERLFGRYVPKWGWCAGVNKHSIYQPDSVAIHQPYCQAQLSKSWKTTIIIDVDGDVDPAQLRAAGIPEPAAYVGRPIEADMIAASRRPHLRWLLEIPVKCPKPGMGRDEESSANRQLFLYNLIRDDLVTKLIALGLRVDQQDPQTTKNPLHSHWDVIEGDVRTWKLWELQKALGVEVPKADAAAEQRQVARDRSRWKKLAKKIYADAGEHHFRRDYALLSRVCMMFESIRGLAYAHKAYCSTYEQLYKWVFQQCVEFNQSNNPTRPIPRCDVKAVAKSISGWTWNKYSGPAEDRDRGACYRAGLIQDGTTKREAQRIGGVYASAKRAENAQKRVLDLVDDWKAHGKDITVSGIARELGISRVTVRKYLPQAGQDAAKTAVSTEVAGGGHLGGYKGGVVAREALTPDLRATRDGRDWSFWFSDGSQEHLEDEDGRLVPLKYVEPYVTWRATPPEVPF